MVSSVSIVRLEGLEQGYFYHYNGKRTDITFLSQESDLSFRKTKNYNSLQPPIVQSAMSTIMILLQVVFNMLTAATCCS